jgi:hypothetical protein
MDVIGAKQRRAELIRKRRELIEGVEARGGKLGATERELMAAWEAEGKRLADLLDEEELKFKRSAEIALGAGPARKDAYGQLGPGEVRTLAPDQRMSDLPTMELPDGNRASDLSLGRIIRSEPERARPGPGSGLLREGGCYHNPNGVGDADHCPAGDRPDRLLERRERRDHRKLGLVRLGEVERQRLGLPGQAQR